LDQTGKGDADDWTNIFKHTTLYTYNIYNYNTYVHRCPYSLVTRHV